MAPAPFRRAAFAAALAVALATASGAAHAASERSEPARRIVSLNPSLTAILLALGARDALVGVDSFSAKQEPAVAELPTVGPGDEVEVRCTYNNTLANPYVELALHEQGLSGPVDVFIGEQTLDEMCLGLVGLITDGTIAPPSEKPVAPPLQLVGNALVIAD